MDRKGEWPVTSLLVDEEWFKHQLDEVWVGVNRNRVEWEDNVDSLNVSITGDFLEEEIWGLWCVGELQSTKRLTDRKLSDDGVVATTCSNRVGHDLVVKGSRQTI